MTELTKEQVYKKIKLTPTQLKAWNELMVSFKKCEKSGILFYNRLETISPMNGKNVKEIEEVYGSGFNNSIDPLSPDVHDLPNYINFQLSGFADDPHKIILKD